MKRHRLIVISCVAAFALATLVVAGTGCGAHHAQIMRTTAISLGSPVGGCVGTAHVVRGDRSTKITRSIEDDGCRHHIVWTGTLLDIDELADKLKAGAQGTVKRAELRFEPLTLTDEVGAPIAVTLPALQLTLRLGDTILLKVAGKNLQNPLVAARTVSLSAKLCALLATHLAARRPLKMKAEATLDLDASTRSALAAVSRRPLIEVRYTATVDVVEGAPASGPAATQPATTQPAG
ncbi:MAG: hypothetical protein KAI47_05115 [Deltaproteobacteria bacterium]|nr:hypothetical protein [Deltaproteobacteria bacterium]